MAESSDVLPNPVSSSVQVTGPTVGSTECCASAELPDIPGDLTQADIGTKIGVSRRQVSRLLSRPPATLRGGLGCG